MNTEGIYEEHEIEDPHHVVVVMDGNGRNGLTQGGIMRSDVSQEDYDQIRMQQHQKSYQTVRDLVDYFFRDTESNILSLRALSSGNVTNRSPEQTSAILRLVDKAVTDADEQLCEGRINFNVLGDPSRLDTFVPGIVNALQEKITRHSYPESSKQLVAILDYDVFFDYYESLGDFIHQFIANNSGQLSESSTVGNFLNVLKMSSKEKCMQYHKPEMLLRGQYLLEEASLVIRTGGLSRTSGLMGLTSGNAHREFEETNFPGFSPDVYKAVIDRYKKKMITGGINNGA